MITENLVVTSFYTADYGSAPRVLVQFNKTYIYHAGKEKFSFDNTERPAKYIHISYEGIYYKVVVFSFTVKTEEKE